MITITITEGQYKETHFVTITVAGDAEGGLRISRNKSFDYDGEHFPLTAWGWISEMTHSILSTRAPAREARWPGYTSEAQAYETATRSQCRCCRTPMQGSDHCPECGCEEYEERCGDPKEGPKKA